MAPVVEAPDGLRQAKAAKPAYDLAGAIADQPGQSERRRRDGRGQDLQSSVVSDVFVVVGPPGGTYDSSVALFRSAMTGYLNGRFDKKPDEAITVYLLPNAQSYENFCTKKITTRRASRTSASTSRG